MKTKEELFRERNQRIEEFDKFLVDPNVSTFVLKEKDISFYENKKMLMPKDVLVKLLISNGIYLLFYSDYHELNLYTTKLSSLGLFDSKTNKLYYNRDYFLRLDLSKSKYYVNSIKSIEDEIKEHATNMLINYIKENKEELKKLVKNKFNKQLEVENFQKDLMRNAATNYIFEKNNSLIEVEFDEFVYFKKKYKDYLKNLHNYEIKDYVLFYLLKNKSKDEISKELLGGYLIQENYCNDTEKELIGLKLLKNEYVYNLTKDIYRKDENKENNIYKKTKEVIQSIVNVDAKYLTITLNFEGNETTFKYSKEKMLLESNYGHDCEHPLVYLSPYGIKNAKERDAVYKLLKDDGKKYDNYINYITKITYGKKVLYQEENK